MTINILLGVGGSGAKIVESALFLLSTGLGPRDKVIVGLVDQDNSNGNLNRTLTLLNTIRALRADFSAPSGNLIAWPQVDSDDGTHLLGIEVEPLLLQAEKEGRTRNSAHWRPAADDQPTLRDILRHDPTDKDESALFDFLFRGEWASPDEVEQTMVLSEGYRGRAHIGASALVAALHHDQPEFLARLTEAMKASSTGQEVRIFVAGSLFGGTGAAGFPTIARSLNNLRGGTGAGGKEKGIKADQVRIGGVLMLPYFTFSDPQDDNANVITAPQLLPQARVAIEYYERLLQQENVFDRLYVAGWDKMFDLNYHQPGREEQRNPALLPELVAALAALDFFTLPKIEREPFPLACARRNEGEVGWADLPGNEVLARQLYDRLGGALRFAVWWLFRVEPAMEDRGMFGIKTPWLKRLASGTDWQKGTPDARVRLREYAKALLEWASSMRLFSRDGAAGFALWNPISLLVRMDLGSPANPVELFKDRSEEDTRLDIDAILHPSDPQDPPVSAQRLYDDLTSRTPAGAHQGLGRVVAGVYEAAQPFRRGGART